MEKITVEVTRDYDKFKLLEDNRDITEHRVKKIINSINEVGYVLNPILVNENYEIIDGQGRFTALKRLGLPQYYIMQKGLGINECRHMNINQTNWTVMDYINSHAKSGNPNYLRLKTLIDSHELKPTHTMTIATGVKASINGDVRRKIQDGSFQMSREDYDRLKWVVDYAERFKDVAKAIGGKQDHFFIAIRYAYENLNTYQRNTLEEVIKKNVPFIPSLTVVVDYLKVFDELYNKRKQKANKINLEMSWRLENM